MVEPTLISFVFESFTAPGGLIIKSAYDPNRNRIFYPFPLKELHPDNGSEFFNAHLVRYWKEKVTGVKLSRSRPWHKNDNRLVEQKNDTLVRQYLGDLRLDTPEQIAALHTLYEDMW